MTKQTNTRRDSFSVYFAGDLWTHKDLIGNALLADYIRKVSKGRYLSVLPQDLEEPVHRTVDIRNVDLKHVMTSDMAIFNFDGANLDSGTVVEFIYAKMLDIPCVLLRTDFRAAGEGNAEQDPWNLMASHWPRSRVLKLHGMAEYQSNKAKTLRGGIDRMYRKMATQIVEALDAVRAEAPLASAERNAQVFDWALRIPGAGYDALFAKEEVAGLIAAKAAKGLLAG
jgi:nucleoside 2-deoxyribosyltransferase